MPSEGKDFCGQCQRRVHNLDGMSDRQRQLFLASCSGDVCVAYTVQWPQRLAKKFLAGAVAAVALGGAGAAVGQGLMPAAEAMQTVNGNVVTGTHTDPNSGFEMITVGGVKGAPVWIDESELTRNDPPPIGEIDDAQWLPSPNSDK